MFGWRELKDMAAREEVFNEHRDHCVRVYGVAKYLSRFRHVCVSSLVRLYSTPEQYHTKVETHSFQTVTFSLKTEPY